MIADYLQFAELKIDLDHGRQLDGTVGLAILDISLRDGAGGEDQG